MWCFARGRALILCCWAWGRARLTDKCSRCCCELSAGSCTMLLILWRPAGRSASGKCFQDEVLQGLPTVPWHRLWLDCTVQAVFCCLGVDPVIVLIVLCGLGVVFSPTSTCRNWHPGHRRRISIKLAGQYDHDRAPGRLCAAQDAFAATLAAAATARRQALLMSLHPKCAHLFVRLCRASLYIQ